MLLLCSRNPEQEWTIDRVVEVVRSSAQSICERLERLTHNGFLKKQDTPPVYHYEPATPVLAAEVLAVSMIYKERPVKVIEQIFAKPSSSVLGFADAFKIKKQP